MKDKDGTSGQRVIKTRKERRVQDGEEKAANERNGDQRVIVV